MKCIITGLGGRGLFWVNQLTSRKDCEIVGYVEPFEGSRTRAINEYSIPAERSLVIIACYY